MTARLISLRSALLAAAALSLGALRATSTELSPAEKIYADLAKLPAAERTAKIEAGARKEGAIALAQTLRDALGDGQIQLFANRYPFLKVEWTSSLGSPEATERMFAEETAGRHLTDAVQVSILDFQNLLKSDFLARYPTPATAKVLPQYRKFLDPENRWVLSFWSDRNVIYNTSLVPPEKAPKTWMDLCDPFFKGNVSFDPVQARFVAGLYEILGDKLAGFMKCMGANKPIIARGVSQRTSLMLVGDHMVVADSYPYQAIAAQRKNAATPVGFMPATPLIASFGAVGMNRNTAHPYATALFADWIVSDEAQGYLAKVLRGPVTIKHPYLPDGAEVVAPDLPKDLTDKLVHEWGREVEGRK
jgi:iron(III) transport system substrate-binding protein